MKVVWKIVLLFALVFLVLGAALIGVSLFSGGGVESVRNNVPLMNFEQSFPDETPSELRIELPAGRLTVETGDVLRVEATDVAESCFECSLENGVLTVREKRDDSWSNTLSRLISLGKREPEYHIWLPRGTALARAEVRVAAGSAELRGLHTDVLQLNMAAGTVSLPSLRARSTVVEMAAGELALYDLDTDILLLQTAAGNAGVSGTVRSRCAVELAAGAASLKLTGSAADYTAQLEAAAGSIDYAGTRLTLGRTSVGSGANAVALRCGAGSIDVQFFG